MRKCFSLLILAFLLISFFLSFFLLSKNIVQGKANDFIGDMIFGKSGYGEVVPNQVTGNRVFLPAGVLVDRSTNPNRVYIWDSGNSRILGFSSLGTCIGGSRINQPCTNNLDCSSSTCQINPTKNADIIIGQPDAFHSACNGDSTQRNPPTAATLCSQRLPYQISLVEGPEPNNLAVDQNHNLYVVDKWNQRVLKYNDPFATDNIADQVWGQADFASRGCNHATIQGQNCGVANVPSPTSNSLCLDCHETEVISGEFGASGLDVEPNGANLWVADGANHRVLRFPTNSKTANLVIGQPDFNSRNERSCVIPFYTPAENYLCRPKVVRYNSLTNQLFVLDWANENILFRILIYNPPFTNGMSPSEIIYGSPNDEYKKLGSDPLYPNWSYYRLNRPMGLELDPFVANAFWLTDAGNNRALYFQKINSKWQPTKVLAQPNLERTKWAAEFSCSNLPQAEHWRCEVNPGGGIGIDSAGNIYLESNYWEQVLRFSAPIPTPIPGAIGDQGVGYAAEAVIVKQQENAPGHSGFNFVGPAGIYNPSAVLLANYSNGGKQMLVADRYRVLVWDDYPNKASGAPANAVLFQNDFYSQINTGCLVRQMTTDSQGRIWLAKERCGIYVFQGPISSSSQPTIIPLTLPLKNSTSPITLSALVGIAYDEIDDALWASDVDNYRIVRIHQPLSSAREVDLVLGQPDINSHYANRGVDIPKQPPCLCPAGISSCPKTGSQCWGTDMECPNMSADGFGQLNKLGLDKFNNLYVIDGSHEGWQCSNNRLLEFDKVDISQKLQEGKVFFNDPEPNNRLLPHRVYGASGFFGSAIDRINSEKNKYIRTGYPNYPYSVSFTPSNDMLITVDAYGNTDNAQRIFLLRNPLRTCPAGQLRCHIDEQFSELAPGSSPSSANNFYIPVAVAQPEDSSIDDEGNLAFIDSTWNRVLFFQNPFCSARSQGDLNCDGKINEADLTILLNRWGEPGLPTIATLMTNWKN